MSVQEVFGLASVIISIVGYLPYIRDLFLKRTKPHVFSWVIFTIMGGTGFVAQMSDGAGAGAWTLAAGTLMSFIILIGSIRHGEKNITKVDKISFGLSLSIIPAWLLVKDPTWAVVIVSIVYSLAFIPTARKSYNRPYEETLSSWVLNALKFLLAYAALENISFITAYLPVYLFLANGALAVMLLTRRFVLSDQR